MMSCIILIVLLVQLEDGLAKTKLLVYDPNDENALPQFRNPKDITVARRKNIDDQDICYLQIPGNQYSCVFIQICTIEYIQINNVVVCR